MRLEVIRVDEGFLNTSLSGEYRKECDDLREGEGTGEVDVIRMADTVRAEVIKSCGWAARRTTGKIRKREEE